MMKTGHWALSVALLALTACGGGGTTAAPPPVSVPSPTPPPPPPPPPTATVRVFGTATGPSFFNFYTDETFIFDSTVVGGYGSREGEYFSGFARGFQPYGYGVGGGDLSSRAKAGQVIDSNTGTYLRFRAPAAAKVISPVTLLLLAGPQQDKLKRQLGIVGSLFGLQSVDPDLLTYDPIAEAQSVDPARRADAARLLAANARALALEALLQDSSFLFISDSSALGSALANAPDRFLFSSNADMTTVVASLPSYSSLRPDVQSAIAHLIDAYAAAVPVQIANADQASRYLLGVTGYLASQIRALRQANNAAAAAAALAVTAPQIIAAVSRYDEAISVTTTGFFFPGPDHYETSVNTPLRLTSGVSTGQLLGHPLENDLYANGPTGAIGFFGTSGLTTITSVSVPGRNTGEVSAALGLNNEILITPATGFTGLTYVDYTVSHTAGETRSARIYVRVQ